MSTDLKKSNSTLENVPDPLKAAPELEEGEIANEEPTISPTRLKASHKESKSSSKKHKHKIKVLYPTSSDSDSSDPEEESRKGWWHKKKLHASSSQLSSSEAKEEDSSDDEYIEKPMPDFTTFRNRNRNYRKRKNRKRKEFPNKAQDFSNDSPLSSTSKEDNPETKKKKLYPCKSYIAFGKCDDIKCRCIHAPLNKEEELHRFIDENEEFFSNAFKDFPNSQLNPSLLQFLSQKFGPSKSQNTLHLNLNLNKNDSFTRPMPPPKFFSPQLPHSHYPIYNPSPPHIHPGYSFPMPQVFSPQSNNLNPSFPRPQVCGNPSIYFEFNMQQNLTYLPQDPRIFSPQPVFLNDISMQKQPNTLLPTSIISPNNKSEIVQMQFVAEPRPVTMNIETENKVNGSPNKTQTTFPNCFIASKDAPAMLRRRQSSIDTAPGSETYECHEKVISPDQDISAGGNQEKEEEIKKAKTAEKITKLMELFKAKQMNKQKQEEGDKAQEKKNEDMFKEWEETSPNKKPQMKSKFENESANDELLKKIKSALAESSTSSESGSGSGNVKDLVNMYLKMSKNLIMENNSIH